MLLGGILVALSFSMLLAMGQSEPGSPDMGARGTDYDLSRHTIDGGGVMFSTGGDFELSGTIGQPDAGVMTGGDLELAGGFWFALAPGDCDDDGGVNLFDYDALATCLAGPDSGLTPPQCACFDVDRDTDVDLVDFAAFQNGFTGEG